MSEPWQVPAFYGRSFAPQAYKRPTATPLAQTIAVEGVLTIGAAQSTRNPSGGTEATLGPQDDCASQWRVASGGRILGDAESNESFCWLPERCVALPVDSITGREFLIVCVS